MRVKGRPRSDVYFERKLVDLLIRECDEASKRACIFGFDHRLSLADGTAPRSKIFWSFNRPQRMELVVRHSTNHSEESVRPIIEALRKGGFLR